MKNQLSAELKVGMFVSLGVFLIMVTILVLGSAQSLFSRKDHFKSHLNSVDGLIVGAKVIVAGVPVGVIENIRFDKVLKNIEINFSVSKEGTDWIHQGASLEIATQGVLGDKYLNIEGGNPNEPLLPPNSDIPSRPSKDISQFLTKGDQIMVTLGGILNSLDRILKTFEADHRNEIFFKGMAQTAHNLSQATDKVNNELDQMKLKAAISNLNQIFEKINDGTGTIGALINDSSLYDDLKALLGGVNRNRIMRNLVRQTVKDGKDKDTKKD